jgi:hypothetical protein
MSIPHFFREDQPIPTGVGTVMAIDRDDVLAPATPDQER